MSNDTQLEANGSVPGHNEVMLPHGEPPRMEHGVAVQREAKEERSDMLDKLFESYRAAGDQAKKEIDSVTSPEWMNYESRTVMLKKNAEHAPKTASLTDRVRKLGL